MRIKDSYLRASGLALAICYATFIVWLQVRQPQTFAEVAGGLAAEVGVYRIDQQAFDDGLALFRRDEFEASRAAFDRADPVGRDARTQFYIAYSYYRAGWGRLYQDNELFKMGLERIDRAIALAPGGRLVVEDPELSIHNADELRAELAGGLKTELSDFNPVRVFGERK